MHNTRSKFRIKLTRKTLNSENWYKILTHNALGLENIPSYLLLCHLITQIRRKLSFRGVENYTLNMYFCALDCWCYCVQSKNAKTTMN